MKYNVLAAVVAGALLSACNSSSSDDSSSLSLQAYDPEIQYMDVFYKCNDDSSDTQSGQTDFNGNAVIASAAVVDAPEVCEFTFDGGAEAIDTSNGKSMTGVIYSVPKGLAQAGQQVTASPLTTAIYNALDGADYDEATASTILEELGLGDLINGGVSISDLLLKTSTVVGQITTAQKATLLATTAVLSDVIKNNPDATSAEITAATKKLATAIVDANPSFPTTTTGKPAVVTVDLTVAEIEALTDTELAAEADTAVEDGEAQVDPDGATGTGTGTGSTSGGN
jgi:hypothetical protein